VDSQKNAIDGGLGSRNAVGFKMDGMALMVRWGATNVVSWHSQNHYIRDFAKGNRKTIAIPRLA
jgi:hypothetical protein